ncbi:MAG: AAA family ATPase, partial [Chloroflexota bacterium]
MLKRLYVDNYKCLVDFELNFDAINLFLGANGSGKSTVFEVLQKLRAVVNGESRVSEEFTSESRTRWQASPLQRFELEISDGNQTYRYELGVEYPKNAEASRVEYERLWLDERPLLKFEGQEAIVYKGDFSEGSKFPFDGSRTVIEFL